MLSRLKHRRISADHGAALAGIRAELARLQGLAHRLTEQGSDAEAGRLAACIAGIDRRCKDLETAGLELAAASDPTLEDTIPGVVPATKSEAPR